MWMQRLLLAVPLRVYENLLSEKFGQLIISRLELRVLLFDETEEKVVQWIRSNATDAS